MEQQVSDTTITYHQIRDLVGKDNPLIIEVGANNGSASNAFIKTFPACRLECFEPDPRAIAKWRTKVRSERARLWEAAVGDFNGVTRFHMSDGLEEKYEGGYDKSGSILAPKEVLRRHPTIRFERAIDVKIYRLDDWASDNGFDKVDFIWADVQGAETNLIRGATKVLSRTRFFYAEYSRFELYEGQKTLEEIKAMLPHFRVKMLFRGDVLFENVDEGL